MIKLKAEYGNSLPTLLTKSYQHYHHHYPANPTATLLILNQPYKTGAIAGLNLQI